jgi:hypothetical protein
MADPRQALVSWLPDRSSFSPWEAKVKLSVFCHLAKENRVPTALPNDSSERAACTHLLRASSAAPTRE